MKLYLFERSANAYKVRLLLVSLAPEGGILLEPWPSVVAWVKRVEALPGWIRRV